ncbi:MAG: PPOX class F420-dependent oxidoreductase [Caulobacterales bacterium]
MATTVPDNFRDLISDGSKAYAHLATTMKDGSPQVTPVWFDFDGDVLRVNSAQGRVKTRNMQVGSKVAVSIMDPANPYRYVQVRGVVKNVTEQGARDHINKLSHKYNGVDYPVYPGEVRVTFRIEPTAVQAMG